MNMDTEIFESSEFYRRRYDNFSTMIVFPVFLAVVGILLFSFVGHREITVKTVGEIAPAGTVAQVQSTSNQHIVVNNLMENKVVRKGIRCLRMTTIRIPLRWPLSNSSSMWRIGNRLRRNSSR